MVLASANFNSQAGSDELDLLLTRISQPATAQAIGEVLDRVELISTMLRGLDEVLMRGDVIADSLSEGLGDLRRVAKQAKLESSINLSELLTNLAALAAVLPRATQSLTTLLDSDMLRPQVIEMVSSLADSGIEAQETVRKHGSIVKGLTTLLRSIRDPDVQRGLSFAIETARATGKRMS